MAREIIKNIYIHEVTLPVNILKAVNCYIILSEDRNLVIDTGFNLPECRESLFGALNDLSVDLSKTDLFITHLHGDHCGLVKSFADKGVQAYTSETDGKLINMMRSTEYKKVLDTYINLYDLYRDSAILQDPPGFKFAEKVQIDFKFLKEGDIISVGDYNLEVIETPGHTPGHIGLYDRKHKLFFCGDHILDSISPNIAFWGFEQDILSVYMDSLRKVYAYEIDYLFTAHRNIIRDHRRRIDELLHHHEERLQEILDIISEKEMSVSETARRMKWSVRGLSWNDFPAQQKWFACGEAMSHLEHLVYIGKAEKRMQGEVVYYKKK
ncbi:MAG: MBL fold metallo-hydrolase [Clostridiales bacterium]|nr:MBL fold metallo-hydrolase [Clostridiales bacterium]